MRAAVGSNRKTFGLFGNSAGAQYVLRYLALTDGTAVEAGVAANCGAYMLPDLAIDHPVGMGGLDLDEAHLRRYLGRRLIVLLGDADTDSAAHDLPRDAPAIAQGPHRLAVVVGTSIIASRSPIGSRRRSDGPWKSSPGPGTSIKRFMTEALSTLRVDDRMTFYGIATKALGHIRRISLSTKRPFSTPEPDTHSIEYTP